MPKQEYRLSRKKTENRCLTILEVPVNKVRSRLPRSEPVVGRARISDYGLLKISPASSPCAKGLWVANPDSPGDSSRHCNDRVHSRPILGGLNSQVFSVFGHASGVRIEVGISAAFGCTLQGEVAGDDRLRVAAVVIEAGADEAGLSDTTGMANPAQVLRLFKRLRTEIGYRAGAAHMHKTRGLGLVNCLAAYDVGVRTFDGSLGGLGGCPYAARRLGQCGDERPGVHVRGHGPEDRRQA